MKRRVLQDYIYITSSYLSACDISKNELSDYLAIELDKHDYCIKGVVVLIDVLLDKSSISNMRESFVEIREYLKESNEHKASFFKQEIIVRPLSEYTDKNPNLLKLMENVKECGLSVDCIKPYISIPKGEIMQWVDGALKISTLTARDRDMTGIKKNITKRKAPIIWVEKFHEEAMPDDKRFCPLNHRL